MEATPVVEACSVVWSKSKISRVASRWETPGRGIVWVQTLSAGRIPSRLGRRSLFCEGLQPTG